MFEGRCPGNIEVQSPKPQEIHCHKCGECLEIWSDETQVVCVTCGQTNVRPRSMSCIDWCAFVKECLGNAGKFEKILRTKK